MAVGKGSMARASKAAAASKVVNSADAKEVAATQGAVPKTRAKKTAVKSATKKNVKSTAKTNRVSARVIDTTSEQVMSKIVYQESSQMLNRDAKPGEIFAVGDAMPVYYF